MRLKLVAICLAGVCVGWCSAQTTEPIQPKTPDIQVPPPISISGPPGSDPLGGKPVTADEAAKIALERQRSLALARAALKSASGQKKSVGAAQGPNLSLGTGYTDLNQIRVDSSSGSSGSSLNGYSSSVTLKQLLFDFSHSADLTRQASYLVEAAKQSYERARADLVLQVKRAFYTAVQSAGLADAAEQNVKNRQAQLDLAQARLDSGLGAPADVVNAKTYLADAVSSLTQARASAASARISLALAMGLDPRTAIVTKEAENSESLPEELGALVDQALRDRPEQVQALAVLKAAEAGLRAARTGNAPGLYFNAGYSGRGLSDPLNSQNATYGVTLSWTLFDSGSSSGRVEQAKAGVEAAQADLDLTSQSVIADVAQAYVSLKTAEQRSSVADASLANAQEGVRLSQGRYRAGVTTFLEVTSAQTSLFTAQTDAVNAKSAIQQARAALARAVGHRVS
jgi:outer membrane protein